MSTLRETEMDHIKCSLPGLAVLFIMTPWNSNSDDTNTKLKPGRFGGLVIFVHKWHSPKVLNVKTFDDVTLDISM